MLRFYNDPLIFGISLLLLLGCGPKKSEQVWEQSLFQIGIQSSPRLTDLNQDGISDIVIGVGKGEMVYTEQGIIALDGKTGSILWQHEANGQIIGSASFCDITGDGIKDVFIGGRRSTFKALDGKTGALIWEYIYQYETDPILKYAHFNFYNSVLVPDQNQDGLPDLLTINGGNWYAKPYSTEDRYPGVLMLLDIKTGNILAADTMPDGKESYMSPLCFAQPEDGELKVIFGTGGETISGNLYLASLSDLKEKKLSQAKILASENEHGFIAPPVLADITQDNYFDIVATSHAGRLMAIDGRAMQLLWQHQFAQTESSNGIAIGQFTPDEVPDIFTTVSKGKWPDYTKSLQIMIDGRSGEISYIDSIGCFGFSSPVVYDLNKDGVDEAIIASTQYDCREEVTKNTPETLENKLLYIDFRDHSSGIIDQTQGFKNIFSSPWIGDIDQNGYLDIVYCQNYYAREMYVYLGMKVKRISTPVRMSQPLIWGSYMGTNGDGIFPLKNKDIL